MKKIFWIALVLVLGVVLYYNQPKTNNTGKPIVKIGITVPLTGPMAYIGTEMRQAIQLKLSELKNTKYDYQVVFEDDQLQSSKEFSNAQKFINFDGVDVIVSMFAGSGEAIANLAKQKDILHFDFTWSDKIVASSPNTFVYYTDIRDLVKEWMKVANQKGYKRISVINNDTHLGGEYVISEIKKNLPKYPNMEIVDIERIPFVSADIHTIAYKMEQKHPDVYLTVLLNPSLDLWKKELNLKNNKIPVSSIAVLEASQDRQLFDGSWFVQLTQPNKNVMKEYKNTYGKEPSSILPIFGYGLVNQLVKLYEKYDTKPSIEQIKKDIYQISGEDDVFGPVSVDNEGQFHFMPSLLQVKDGQFIPMEK